VESSAEEGSDEPGRVWVVLQREHGGVALPFSWPVSVIERSTVRLGVS